VATATGSLDLPVASPMPQTEEGRPSQLEPVPEREPESTPVPEPESEVVREPPREAWQASTEVEQAREQVNKDRQEAAQAIADAARERQEATEVKATAERELAEARKAMQRVELEVEQVAQARADAQREPWPREPEPEPELATPASVAESQQGAPDSGTAVPSGEPPRYCKKCQEVFRAPTCNGGHAVFM
jgi:hypothetical protein